MLKIFIVISAFLLTFLGVELFRRWSLEKEILDLPNERSSHTKPTPVGGGLVIVTVSLFLYAAFLFFNNYSIPWSYIAGAVLVTLISWLDDLFSVPVVVRFLCHALAALIVIRAYENFSSVYLPFAGEINFYFFTPVILFFWIVWMINAYNFMDGIDGIAAVQAITGGIGWIFIAYQFGLEITGVFAGILAASGIGFILLNWQPAKIFMGDVGSAFLGYTFAVMPLMAATESPPKSSMFFIIAVLLLWLFVFDTLITVVKRILQKRKIWQPHREHLYQQIIRRGYSHQFAAMLYGVCSLAVVSLLNIWIFYGENVEFFVFSGIILISAGIFIFGRQDSFKSVDVNN